MTRLNMNALIQPLTKQAPLTPVYTALAGSTGLYFSNTGRELIAIVNGATPSTYTVNVGATVEGQAVAAFTGSLPTSNAAPILFGPFPRDFNQNDGANSLWFDVGTATTVTVAILQYQGVS